MSNDGLPANKTQSGSEGINYKPFTGFLKKTSISDWLNKAAYAVRVENQILSNEDGASITTIRREKSEAFFAAIAILRLGCCETILSAFSNCSNTSRVMKNGDTWN